MQRPLAYHLSSSDELSSDESQTPELFQLQAPSKKLCTSHERIAPQPEQRDTPSPSSNLQLQEQQNQDAELLQGKQEQNPEKDEPQEEEQELEEFAEEFHEEEEELEVELEVEQERGGHLQGQPQDNSGLPPARKVRQKTYALDQKELPLEMAKFLQEVKRFFTCEVNLQRQAKPLAASTFQKAHERILCELFRKFGENSFHGFIIVVSINVLTSSFSCLQVFWDS